MNRAHLIRAATATALGTLIIALAAWRAQERSPFAVAMRTFGYGLLHVAVIAVALGVCTLWNGPLFGWYLPDFSLACLHTALLMQAMFAAMLAAAAPVPATIAQRALLAMTDWRSSRTSASGGAHASRHHR